MCYCVGWQSAWWSEDQSANCNLPDLIASNISCHQWTGTVTSVRVYLEGFVWNQSVFHFTAVSLSGKRGGHCLGSLHRTLMCRSEWLEGQCAGQPGTHCSACCTMLKTAQPCQASPKLLLYVGVLLCAFVQHKTLMVHCTGFDLCSWNKFIHTSLKLPHFLEREERPTLKPAICMDM